MLGVGYLGCMILVTGATGLVGAHLLMDLTRLGNPVRATYRTSTRQPFVKHVFSYYLNPNDVQAAWDLIEWVQADLLELHDVERALKDVTTVYHCAAQISFSPKDAWRMRENNPVITANLVNLCLEFGVQRFCHVSSVAALGRTEQKGDTITEDTAWKNGPENSNYAISKYDAEREVWRGMEEGLSAVIVNPSIIVGPGFWHEGSGKLVSSTANGLPYYTLGVNAFVDVRDVVEAMVLLTNSPIHSQRFILFGDHLSYRDLFFHLADVLDVKRPWFKAAPWMTEVVWRLEAIRSRFGGKPLITKETARSARGVYTYSNDKVLQALPDFHFRPIKKTLEDVAAAYRQDFPLIGKKH